jgi:hypothetical protein
LKLPRSSQPRTCPRYGLFHSIRLESISSLGISKFGHAAAHLKQLSTAAKSFLPLRFQDISAHTRHHTGCMW